MKLLRACTYIRDARDALSAGFYPEISPFSETQIVQELQELAGTRKHFACQITPGEVIRDIGRGGAAQIKLVENSDGLFADKIYDKSHSGYLLSELLSLLILNQENIVNVFEAGDINNGNNGAIRLEYLLNGNPLDIRVDLNDQEQAAEFLNLFKKLATALRHCHESGIVHRDLKAKNIMVYNSCNAVDVKLIDFNSAKITRKDDLGIVVGELAKTVGTIDYMPPEQFDSANEADFSSDIYSLVTLLYNCLSGTHPFSIEHDLSVMDVFFRISTSEPRDIRELNQDIKNEQFAVALKGALKGKQKERVFKSTKDFEQFIGNLTPEKLKKRKAIC